MTPDDRLLEIRDLLVQLLAQAHATAQKQDEIRAAYRAEAAGLRRRQQLALALIVPLIALLFYVVFR